MPEEIGGLRVLHVDDDPDFLFLFERKFNKFFTTVKAQSVDEALDILKKEKFDAIITDYEMPDKNGIDLLKELKSLNIETPVVFCTGQGNEEIARESFICGASDYFSKDLHGFAQKEKLFNSVTKAVAAGRNQKEKRKTEDKYRTLINNSHDIIYTLTIDGVFSFVSPAWTILMGYSSEEALGSNFRRFVYSEDHERCNAWFEKILSSRERQDCIDYRVFNKNGVLRWHTSSGVPMRDENGKVIGFEGTARDITEQKHALELLISERDNSAGIIRTAPVIICGILKEEGTCTFINPAGEQATGYKADEITGKNWWQTFYPGNEYRQVEKLFLALKDGRIRDYEMTLTRRDNEKRTISWSSLERFNQELGKMEDIGFGHDVTRRRKTEEALKKSEENLKNQTFRLENIIRGTNVGTWEWHIPTGQLIINSRWAEIAGYTLEELGPVSLDTWIRFAHPEDLQKSNQLLERHFKGELDYYDFESRMRHKDGSWVWVQDRGKVAQWSADGKPLWMFGTHQDITRRKEYEDNLRESENAVRNKLQAILEPEGDMGALSLADIIDRQKLQKMMEELYKVTGFSCAVIDIEGKVLVAVGWQDLCTRFHRVHPETLKNCIESDVILSNGVEPGKSKAYRCKNNLWDISTPIIVGGKHLGNMFAGQFLYDDEPFEPEIFHKQAQKFGFNEKEYFEALEKVPRWSRDKVEAVMSFYGNLAQMVASLSYSAIKLARALSRKDETLKNLAEREEKYRQILENLNHGIWRIDQDARTVFVNPRMAEILGYAVDEMTGKSLFELIIPEDENLIKEYIERRCQGIREYHDSRFVRKDGKMVSVRMGVVPLFNQDGKYTGAIAGVEDITPQN